MIIFVSPDHFPFFLLSTLNCCLVITPCVPMQDLCDSCLTDFLDVAGCFSIGFVDGCAREAQVEDSLVNLGGGDASEDERFLDMKEEDLSDNLEEQDLLSGAGNFD